MSTEISTEICVQRCLQRFCPLTLSHTTSYYANLAAPTNPHDILTLNVVISSHEPESPYPPGTTLSVRGKLAPGSKGAMVTLQVSEHLRVDRTLANIPTKATLTVFGAARKMARDEEDWLVIQTEWDGPAIVGIPKHHIHCAAFEAIATEDAVVVAGTFAGVYYPFENEQPILGLVPQTLTVTGCFSYPPETDGVDDVEELQRDSLKSEAESGAGSNGSWAPTWSKEDEDVRAVSSLLQDASNDSSSVEATATDGSKSDDAEVGCGDTEIDEESKDQDPDNFDEGNPWTSTSSNVHTPAGLARRIPDVLSLWSSPVLAARPSKRPSESVYGERDDRKRQRREGL